MPAHVFQDSDEEEAAPAIQSLTEFSNDTVEDKEADVPLVIERLPNTFRRGNRYVPQALHQPNSTANGQSIAELEAAERTRNNVYGLNRPVDRPTDINGTGASPSATTETVVPPTEEELALRALVEPENVERNLTIESIGANELFGGVALHPDMSSLEDYEAVPVESFGLAMLRGMGYDPNVEAKKVKAKEKTRRPDFLGLGASERPEDSKSAEELAKKRYQKRKEERNYVPVVRINKRTGEVVKDEATAIDLVKPKSEFQSEQEAREANGHSRREQTNTVDTSRSSRVAQSPVKPSRGDRSRSDDYRSSRSDSRDRTRSRRHRTRSPGRRSDSRRYENEDRHSSSRHRSYDDRKQDRDLDRGSSRKEPRSSGDRRHRDNDR